MKKLAFGMFLSLAFVFLSFGPNAATADAAACYVFNNDLSYGMTFGEVLELQKFLAADGSFTVELTGTFGPLTRSALAQYQAKNGIQATGYFGPMTRARVNASGCGQVLGAYDQLSVTTVATGPLTLVAPMSGTRLQLQNTHTIAWTPADRMVDGFLEVRKGGDFEKVWKLLSCGATQAGLLRWCGVVDNPKVEGEDRVYPKTGEYYLSIVDTTTKEVSRTSSPIRVVEFGSVIKLDAKAHLDGNKSVKAGQDTAITVSGKSLTMSWSSAADSCSVGVTPISDLEVIPDADSLSYDDLPRHVTKQVFNFPGQYDKYRVYLSCRKDSNTDARSFEVTTRKSTTSSSPSFESTLIESEERSDESHWGGNYYFKFNVTAGDKDMYVRDKISKSGASDGMIFEMFDSFGKKADITDYDIIFNLAAESAYPVGNIDGSNMYYKIPAGQTVEGSVEIDVRNPVKTGTYKAKLDSIIYSPSTSSANKKRMILNGAMSDGVYMKKI